jgi:hypothetical protein
MIDPKHILSIRDRIIRERGGLTLLALFEPDEYHGTWDLLIAGGGLTSESLQNYEYVTRVLHEELTRGELLTLTKFVLVREETEPVQDLVGRVQVMNGDAPVELQYVQFGRILIRRALIFHAERSVVGAARA